MIKKNISYYYLACALTRYQTNGKLDSSFGIDGFIYFDGRYSKITGIVAQQSNNIIGIGDADVIVMENLIIGFGAKGKLFTAFSGHTNLLNKFFLDTDNKIVAAGSSNIKRYGYGDFALSRYLNNSSNSVKPEVPLALKSYNKNDLKTVSTMK